MCSFAVFIMRMIQSVNRLCLSNTPAIPHLHIRTLSLLTLLDPKVGAFAWVLNIWVGITFYGINDAEICLSKQFDDNLGPEGIEININCDTK